MAIPWILGINWWWFLLTSSVEEYLRFKLKAPPWLPSITGAWFLAQAGWLKLAEPGSQTIYLYVAMFVLDIFASFLPAAWSGGCRSDLVSTSSSILFLVGVFVFRSEAQRHFRERDPRGIELGVAMTLFFSMLYFQYWFHQIWVEQSEVNIRVG